MCDQVVLEGVEADGRTEGGRADGGRTADGGIQNQKQEPHTKMWGIKMAPAAMSCKLAMWHIYLISTVSAVPP